MNTSLLQLVWKNKGYTKKSLCNEIGMTTNGFDHALKNMTLKVRDLERIAEVLGVPITLFFDSKGIQNFLKQGNNSTSNMAGSLTQNGVFGNENRIGTDNESELLQEKNNSLKKEIEGLKAQLSMKDEIIGILKNQ